MSALLSPEQAAERLHMSERTLRDIKRKGMIRYVALSARKIVYRVEDCEEYIASRVRQDQPAETAPQPKPQGRGGKVIPFSKQMGAR